MDTEAEFIGCKLYADRYSCLASVEMLSVYVDFIISLSLWNV